MHAIGLEAYILRPVVVYIYLQIIMARGHKNQCTI